MALVKKNTLTIKDVLLNTKKSLKFNNRFDYKIRDYVGVVKVIKSIKFDARSGKRTEFYRIITKSWPQYYPYYTGKDKRGRDIKFQRTYKHEYETVIELEELSLDSRFKARLGKDKKWNFNKNARKQVIYKEKKKRKKNKKTGKWETVKEKVVDKIIEDKNVKRGINGDFFFRCSWVWRQNNILIGRNYANGPPNQTNPKREVFFPKHMLAVVQYLVSKNILKK